VSGDAPGLKRAISALLLVIMGITWGLQFSMLKLAALDGIDEITILFVMLVIVSVCFTAPLIVARRGFALTSERVQFLFITGLLGYALPLAAAVYAAAHVPAGIMTLIASFTPLVTVAVALAVRSERVSPRRLIAVVLAMISALLVLLPEASLPGFGVLPWLVLVFVVPLCYGVEGVYVAVRWPDGLDTLQVVAGEAVFAALMVLPFFLGMGQFPDAAQIWSLGGLAVLVVALSGLIEVFLYFYLIRREGAVFVSFSTFISLFAGIAWGIALFGEVHSAIVWLAVALLAVSLAAVVFERPPQSVEFGDA